MYRKFAALSVTVLVTSFLVPQYTINILGSIIKNSLYPSKRFTKPSQNVLTKEQLKLYNGIDKPELYLSILGEVFDVTKGAKHYGPNQQYNIFVGCDASRSFVTGKFSIEDISDEVADLSKEDLRSLNHWVRFYKKQYTHVGVLLGRYYDENGEITPYGKEVKKLIKSAEKDKEEEKKLQQKYPGCNVEWDPDKGSRFWCSTGSGGIDRDWVGTPMQFYEVNSKSYRCACIKETELDSLGNVKKYDNCDAKSKSCFVKNID
ncbi:unnamed protein product [Phyllotreta striolata]|uniref:Cytochrome b5 heme-binding domain-containing protein n=1 Tax=Phyllotreta striolata TaxID=444603 RepID=A0A9N9TPP3_PHYSR|nr:unnamed protein product [Phyllotreta striolata]